MRHIHLFALSSLALALAACNGQQGNSPAAQASAPRQVELIARDALFGNPERANVQISPDGKYLSWTAPVDGVMNVWVAPANDPSAARAVTSDKARGIRNYFWSYLPDTLLYLRDSGGDEDYHLYALNLTSQQSRDLTPYAKTRAYVTGISPTQPGSILVGMNDRDAKWHDLYRVDLTSGARTLVEKNTHEISGYTADGDYNLRYATHSRADGGADILKRVGNGWQKAEDIPFEDMMTTDILGLTNDGKTLYMTDSRNRNTAAVYAIDSTSGQRTLLAEDARADLCECGGQVTDPRTGELQAVSANYLRPEWKPIGDALVADIKALKGIGPGDAFIMARTLDDKTWVVGYTAPESPAVFYRYDRSPGAEGKLTKLFSAKPSLDGKPLVAMWPQEIKSRDGLTLPSYLTLPAQADPDGDGKANTPVPLVLTVHGGPWARDHYGYSGWDQWLANRGYAVLSVNYRGSTGFGKAFTNAGDGEWAGKMHDDLIDAVQWAIKQGITTPDKVAIMGGSYGGYATLVGLTFTPDTFACGVDLVGPSNLNTLLSTIPPYWASGFEQWARRVGDPRTAAGKQLLDERSPLTHVDNINKPLLIGQGANDPRVHKAESDQIVDAMKARNIPVTYMLFADEGHGFARPENNMAFNAVAENFLAQCLGGRAQPIGEDLKGSSATVPAGADAVEGLRAALQVHTQDVRK
jgi:dipeptidyl aminopeptidase/acylaminoacyl peptidase